jgi:hypothetical protein
MRLAADGGCQSGGPACQPADTAALFAAGNWAAVAASGRPDDWRTHAARGLLGQYERALAGLARFEHEEARFHAAVTRFVAGDEWGATLALETIPTPHARALLALVTRGHVEVLAQLPEITPAGGGLRHALAGDDAFGMHALALDDDGTDGPYPDVHRTRAAGRAPDLYLCAPVEGQLVPPNVAEIACPTLGHLGAWEPAVHPWLAAFDEIVVPDARLWRVLRGLVRVPVSTFPKWPAWAGPLPAVPDGPGRAVDVLLPATLAHPGRPAIARVAHRLLRIPGLEVAVVEGAAGAPERFANAKIVVADGPAAVTALAMGCVVLVPEASALAIWAGPAEGLLTYAPDAAGLDDRVRDVLARWPEHAACARRGAAVVRREFAPARVGSEYLRVMTFLATRPRAPRPALRETPEHRRAVAGAPWMAAPPPAVETARRRAAARRAERLRTAPDVRTLLDLAAEFVLGSADADGRCRDPRLLAAALALYRNGAAQFPDALAVRLAHVRAAAHLGGAAETAEALRVAEAALAAARGGWTIDPREEVFPENFHPACFDYRTYLGLVTDFLRENRPVGDDLVRLALAALAHYAGLLSGDVRHLEEAVRLAPDFAPYRLVLARHLLTAPGWRARARTLLAGLADGSVSFLEAQGLLDEDAAADAPSATEVPA